MGSCTVLRLQEAGRRLGWSMDQTERPDRTLLQLFSFRGNALRIWRRLMVIRRERMVQIKDIQKRGRRKGLPTPDCWELMRGNQE